MEQADTRARHVDLARFVPIDSNPPPSRPGDIERHELVGRCTTFEGRLIVMSAPAGYGKTTVAAQCCRRDTRPTLWHTATANDNDPVAFASGLLAALDLIEPLEDDSVAALTGPPDRLETVLLPALERTCRARRSIAVIDDAHRIVAPRSLEVLRRYVTAAGSGSLVIITSRSGLDIGLARRRVQADLLELGSADLAFEESHTAMVLGRVLQRVEPALVGEVQRRCEGWPAAVAISAQSARFGATAPSGRHRDIADYFSEEVLTQLSTPTLSFLWQSAPLARLNADMCDEVLGRHDSQAVLAELDENHLFVIPLDSERRWYRYHQLFHDLLVERQRRFAPELDIPDLLTRTAHWHRRYGNVAEAVRYAQRAGDNRLVGEVVLGAIDQYAVLGQTETIRLWSERSTDAEICSDPAYAIVAAYVYGYAGDTRRADRFLLAATASPDLGRPGPAGTRALETLLCLVRTVVGSAGVEQMLRDGLRALELEGPANSRWLVGAHRAIGCGYLMRGEPRHAVDALERAVSLSRNLPETRYARIYCLGFLANAYLDIGDGRRAQLSLDEANDLMTESWWEHSLEGLPGCVAAASIAAAHGESARAQMLLAAAGEMLCNASPVIAADAATRLADVALSIRDDEYVDQFSEVARRSLGMLTDVGAIGERFARLHAGANVIDLLETLTPAERRVLNHLATHRTLAQIASLLYVSRSTVKTHVASIYSKLGVSTRSEAVAGLDPMVRTRLPG